ncbi:hypothetical protein ACFYTS_19085 [Nocardia sp. NPDC004151]|uniref:hypothetical protein n=1 Tax=Nocardia sp. NPDC004151 TaxID=3364304 RepID=UPI00369B2800
MLKTPGGDATVGVVGALSGASPTPRWQRVSHREAYQERQEDKLRELVADILEHRLTWSAKLRAAGAFIEVSDRSDEETNEAFLARYAALVGEFDEASRSLAHSTEQLRLFTLNVKLHTALARIDEVSGITRGWVVREGRPGQGWEPHPFEHFAVHMENAFDVLSKETQKLTVRHGLDNPVQPDDDMSRSTIRRHRRVCRQEGTAYVTTSEAELPWWRYYPFKIKFKFVAKWTQLRQR